MIKKFDPLKSTTSHLALQVGHEIVGVLKLCHSPKYVYSSNENES